MHNKIIAHTQEFRFKNTSEISEEFLLIECVYSLGYELKMNPKVYKIDKENSLWIYYEQSCCAINSFFDDFGIIVGIISNKYPFSIYGTINDNESASLTSYYDAKEEKVKLVKMNISGKDFDEISDICVKIEIKNQSFLYNFYELFSNLNYKKSYIALDRMKFKADMFEEIDEEDKDTYYKYFKIDSPYESESFIDSLSIEQMKKLWLVFLKEKISPLEFDYAMNRYKNDILYSLFEWELSLRLALSDMDISISYNNNNFHVTDKNGNKLYFDYNTGNSAEQLFLKILFPVKNTF